MSPEGFSLPPLLRFERLEIGEPIAPASLRAPPETRGLLCRYCGKANEPQRESCWACFKKLGEPQKPRPKSSAAEQEITLVIDGLTYCSSTPGLPADILELMARIRARGYSPELLSEWLAWKAAGGSTPSRGDPKEDIKVFKGQRVSVIRIDGKVYTSDDPKLTPELQGLFQHLEANGVTPELMDYLRQFGKQVKFRPATTVYPSDGDLAFWKQISAVPAAEAAAIAEVRLEKLAQEQAKRHDQEALKSVWYYLIPVGLLLTYYLIASLR